MIETPQVVQTEVQTTAMVHLVAPLEKIGEVMDPAVHELLTVLAEQGITPVGPLFSHHARKPTDTFDFKLSFPVDATVASTGRVHASQLPATKAARTVYQGSYEELGAAWGEFTAWIEAQGLQAADDLWEVYVVGPESNSDPRLWRTELHRPLLD